MNSIIMNMIFSEAKQTEPVANSRIAAGIVYKNRLIVTASNSLKTHPFQKRYSTNENAIHLHAEISVILKAIKEIGLDDLEKSSHSVARAKRPGPRSKNFIQGLAKPCIGCQRAIAAHNIKNVYFTCDDGECDNL